MFGILEWVMIGAMCIVLFKLADAEDMSPWAWAAMTLVACLASTFIPLQFIRVGIAGGVMVALMTAKNLYDNRPGS